MATVKQYNLAGLNANVELGKQGSYIAGTANAVSFYTATDELQKLSIANAVASNQAVTLAQLNAEAQDLVQHITVDVSHTSGAANIATIPAGSRILSVTVEIPAAWSAENNTGTFIEVGDTDSGSRFIRSQDVDVLRADQYHSQYQYEYLTEGTLTYSVTAGGATGGNAIISVVLATDYALDTDTSASSPPAEIELNYLVIAGGGGGGSQYGGGGAGGMKIGSANIAINSYAVTVGSGGSGATGTNGLQGGDGTGSSFNGDSATGGGGGGGYTQINGRAGGSGGGASNTGEVGTGTSGQGNSGGAGFTDGLSYGIGGGGGGAGQAGGNASSGSTGAGGNGSVSSITGSSITYAGGGGGGGDSRSPNSGERIGAAGGAGGGGRGGDAASDNATAGGTNLGGGGGGGGFNGNTGTFHPGKAGGSGVVIISYTTGTMTATGGDITTSGNNTIHTFTSSGTFERTA